MSFWVFLSLGDITGIVAHWFHILLGDEIAWIVTHDKNEVMTYWLPAKMEEYLICANGIGQHCCFQNQVLTLYIPSLHDRNFNILIYCGAYIMFVHIPVCYFYHWINVLVISWMTYIWSTWHMHTTHTRTQNIHTIQAHLNNNDIYMDWTYTGSTNHVHGHFALLSIVVDISDYLGIRTNEHSNQCVFKPMNWPANCGLENKVLCQMRIILNENVW